MGIIYLIQRPAMHFCKKDYKYLVLISLFEPCLYFVGESYALQEMSATTVSLLQNIFPFFLPGIILLSRVEKIKPVMIVGFIISLAGVYLLSYSRLPVWDVTPKGMIYLLLCTGSILCYPILIKKLSARYPVRHIMFVQYTIGAIFLLPVCLLNILAGRSPLIDEIGTNHFHYKIIGLRLPDCLSVLSECHQTIGSISYCFVDEYHSFNHIHNRKL